MDRTIPAAVRRAAAAYGDSAAIITPGGKRISYRDLAERVQVACRALIASGIEAGDRIAIWAPNTEHWVVAALGALSAGGTLVPVSTRFTGPEALDVITRSRARALFVTGPFLGTDRLATLAAAAKARPPGPQPRQGAHAWALWQARGPRLPSEAAPAATAAQASGAAPESTAAAANTGGQAAAADLPGLVVEIPAGSAGKLAEFGGQRVLRWAEFTGLAAGVPVQAGLDRAAAVRPGDVSDILFTSGTTGRSKGAMSAHRQALGVAGAWADCAGLDERDRYLIINPFFHSFGYKAGILACLLTGAAMVPQPVFDPAEAMRLVETERITVLPGAPTIYTSMLEHQDLASRDLSSLRLAVTGAAVVPVALIERMRAELGIDTVLTAYGLTEAVVATMCRPGDDPRTVARTCGRAAAGFEVAIGAAECGQPGEVLLRGPNVMLGYLDDPAATAEAIDSGGWLHTGDVGTLDARGYLTITDRLKDMYICGGFNVYPAEVERLLAGHPGVAEAAVVGIPDGRLGEVGKAFVVARAAQRPAADELIAWCRAGLANYKVPRQFEFRAELPRNPAGKVLKRVLRQESHD